MALLQPGQRVGRAGDSFQRRVDHEEDEDGRGGGERDPEQREVSVHLRYLLGRGPPFGGYCSSPKWYGSAPLHAIGRWAKRVRRKANGRRPWPRLDHRPRFTSPLKPYGRPIALRSDFGRLQSSRLRSLRAMRPDELERQLRQRLDASGQLPAPSCSTS